MQSSTITLEHKKVLMDHYAQFGARRLINKLKKASLPDANFTPRNPALENDLNIIDAIGSFEGLMGLNRLDSFDDKNGVGLFHETPHIVGRRVLVLAGFFL